MTLQIEGVRKRFGPAGRAVLDGVTFDAPRGAITTVLGPSGAGKSTLLGIVAGLVAAEAGAITLDGEGLDHLPAHRRPVTLLMQQPQLFGHLDVTDNVAFGLRVRGVRRNARRWRALELLDLVGVAHLAGRSPGELSGGEQQRVALARALAVEPRVLLADEPFASVDGPVRRELQELLVTVHRTVGTTVVLVTHDLAEALSLSDHLVVLTGGRVVDVGAPAAVHERPSTAFTARLLGFANELRGTVHDRCLHAGELRLPVVRDDEVPDDGACAPTVWVIRPEHIRVGPAPRRGLTGTVRSIRYLGAVTEAVLDVGGHRLTAHVRGHCAPEVGDVVGVLLPAEHLVRVQADPST